MANWHVVEGTVGYDQPFTIESPSGTAKNLTGYTLTMYVWNPGESSELFNGTCTTLVAASGTCKYTFATGDVDDAAVELNVEYLWSIKLTKGSEVLFTTPQTLDIMEGPPI